LANRSVPLAHENDCRLLIFNTASFSNESAGWGASCGDSAKRCDQLQLNSRREVARSTCLIASQTAAGGSPRMLLAPGHSLGSPRPQRRTGRDTMVQNSKLVSGIKNRALWRYLGFAKELFDAQEPCGKTDLMI